MKKIRRRKKKRREEELLLSLREEGSACVYKQKMNLVEKWVISSPNASRSMRSSLHHFSHGQQLFTNNNK